MTVEAKKKAETEAGTDAGGAAEQAGAASTEKKTEAAKEGPGLLARVGNWLWTDLDGH